MKSGLLSLEKLSSKAFRGEENKKGESPEKNKSYKESEYEEKEEEARRVKTLNSNHDQMGCGNAARDKPKAESEDVRRDTGRRGKERRGLQLQSCGAAATNRSHVVWRDVDRYIRLAIATPNSTPTESPSGRWGGVQTRRRQS
jgi:hypothetical protein